MPWVRLLPPRGRLHVQQGGALASRLCDATACPLAVRTEPCGNIRRINVEIPSLSLSDMRRLKATDHVSQPAMVQGEQCYAAHMALLPACRQAARRQPCHRAQPLTAAPQAGCCPTCCPAQIGTYTLFQETYHRPTFKHMHIAGPKSGGPGAGSHRCPAEARHAPRGCARTGREGERPCALLPSPPLPRPQPWPALACVQTTTTGC